MKLSNLKAIVVGYGLFEVFLAQKLAEEFGEVAVYTPCEESFPLPDRQYIGKGVPGVTRAENFEDWIDKADLFVFPDIGMASKQRMLRKMGKRVFGVEAERYEMDREYFAKVLANRGLPVFKYRMVEGIDALREVCKKEKDLWVKLPNKVRGIMETWKHETYKNSVTILDELAHKLGGLRDTIRFMVVEPIEGVEIGCEKFHSAGNYLETAMWGIEVKSEGYVGRVMPMADMPKALVKIDQAMLPEWKKNNICGHTSSELRGKDKWYFMDPCQRFPSPPGEAISEAYLNLPQIMWAVAGGEDIKPKRAAEYVAEVCVYSPIGKTEWVPVDFPDKEFKRLKFRRLCRVNGQYYCLPDKDSGDRICGAIGLGDTLDEACFEAMEAAEKVKFKGKEYSKAVFEDAQEVLDEAKGYNITMEA